MALSQDTDLDTLLCTIYTLTDDIIKQMVESFSFALDRPRDGVPPQKRYNLSVAESDTSARSGGLMSRVASKAIDRECKIVCVNG